VQREIDAAYQRGLQDGLTRPIEINITQQPTQAAVEGGPRALSTPQITAPNFDDDVEIVMKRDTSTQSAQNFLTSVQNLIGN